MADAILKLCPICGDSKPADAFPGTRISNRCFPCLAEYKRQHYQANHEQYKERARLNRLKDVEAYRAAGRARSKADPAAPRRKKAYKLRHADRVKSQSARYRERHTEAIKLSAREWRDRNADLLCHYAANRRVAQGRSTPAWTDVDLITSLYTLARVYRGAGLVVEVDHIVPIQHPLVCGLHVPANLQILPRKANRSKSNRHWPDMPEVVRVVDEHSVDFRGHVIGVPL